MKEWVAIVVVVILSLLIFKMIRRLYDPFYVTSEWCIVMLYTPNIASYSKLTEKINRKYAKENGYDMVVFKDRFANDRAPQWDKVKAIEHCFNMGYKYVFWIDSDAYFNKGNRLDEFLEEGKDIYICDDLKNSNGKTLVNTGTMLFKNTEYTRELMKDWWEWKDDTYLYKPLHEQKILDDMIKTNHKGIKDKIKIYKDEVFNNYWEQIYTDRDRLFVVHMMATIEETRIKMANEKCKELGIESLS